MIVRVIAMCVVAAMLCAALRVQRPEMAMALSLAAGLTALALLYREIAAAEWLAAFRSVFAQGDGVAETVLKAAGISIIAELGAQLCLDSGERALAGRIELASRIAMLGLCAPLLYQITTLARGVFD